MYQILCDEYVLYDPRDDELIVDSPKCKLATNTIGEASFGIYATHPYYGQLKKLKSVFEIRQDGKAIFRGRMTDDTLDFDNSKFVDLEGVMGFFNDSVIRPFVFPDDVKSNAEYVASANKVEFFLKWLIEQHNSQVQPFQQFKLGNVTVADPNNYISRSNEDYANTWEVLKSKLFDSSLGGNLCIRYEEDGNYIDYLEDFLLTNNQKIVFGENLLDITSESDASATYSAIIPLGKKMNEIDTALKDTSRLTIKGLADGDVTDDIVKSGDTLYSKKAVEMYGFIYAPPSESTWEDVTEAANLQSKGIEYLENTCVKLSNTITIKAVDLHFSDAEIEAFRIYAYTEVESKPHNHEGLYRLTTLDIDIQNPQNTVITLGDTQLGMTDINASNKKDSVTRIETVVKDTSAFAEEIQKQVDVGIQELTNQVNNLESDLEDVMESVVESNEYLQSQIDRNTEKLNDISDFLVEEGTSGIWTYRKWNNGTVECWGKYPLSITCGTEYGNMYRTGLFQPDAFPFSIADVYLFADFETEGKTGGFLWASNACTETTPPAYYLMRPVASTVNGMVKMYVKGTLI